MARDWGSPPQAGAAEPRGAGAPAALADGTLLYAALAADGWQLRRAPALAAGPPMTFPAPLPFVAAPAVPQRETGYAPWPSLRPHFWIPFFLDAGPSGRFGGALTAGGGRPGRVRHTAPGCVAPQPFRGPGDPRPVPAAFGKPTGGG